MIVRMIVRMIFCESPNRLTQLHNINLDCLEYMWGNVESTMIVEHNHELSPLDCPSST